MIAERRARLRILRIDPVSILKTGFLISISIAVTIVVASVLSFVVLSGMGVFGSIDLLLGDITGTAGALTDAFTLPVVFGLSLTIAAFEVVLTTTLFVLFGFLYNLMATFTRGLTITFAEDVIVSDEMDI
jgi:hypothetical protein